MNRNINKVLSIDARVQIACHDCMLSGCKLITGCRVASGWWGVKCSSGVNFHTAAMWHVILLCGCLGQCARADYKFLCLSCERIST